MAFTKIRIPTGSKQSGKHVPVVIVQIDEEGNEIAGREENAIMRPDGSIGPDRFATPQAAADECERLNNPRPN